jgi:threonine 3-dehydrogenase
VKVMISDVVPYRLKMAAAMGGLPVLSTQMSLREGAKHYGMEAPDVAIDCAGKSVVRDECLSLLAHRGVMVSVAHGEGLHINDLYGDFVAREMTLIGSEYFAYHELESNLKLLGQHRAYLDQIITHRMGVNEIQRAFELFFGGETGKVVIEQ